ncbi:unnamed protein product [Arabidopsis halleri]
MKQMRIIQETKDKRKKGESSKNINHGYHTLFSGSAPSTILDQNVDETTPNANDNGNGFPSTASNRRKTNVHKEPYMPESRNNNHKEAPSKGIYFPASS